ncbi:MAG: NifU family protein [Candidatus Omnitrophica bacterium]|nr:NifU family protein [Candidatus Omnitrophota bacterium]
MRDQVEKVLKDDVQPMLSSHGGGIELVEVTDDGVVKVRLTGGCCGCPSASATLSQVVENAIKSKVPQVKKVEAV